MKHSAIYEGHVEHNRLEPRRHSFRQRLFLLYLDLSELDSLFEGRWLWSSGRRNLAWFRRADYLGDPERPLRDCVLERVEQELGRRPGGAVRMLTHIRTLGYVFNPVTFYYCFDEEDELEAIVAEITNTPWKERHSYVLDARAGGESKMLTWRFDKAFHVSPFFDMDQRYRWSFSVPGEKLDVRMVNFEKQNAVFNVGLSTERRPITARSLAGVLLRYPLMTFRVHLAIYWQAARLYLKRTPFFTHPDKRQPLQGPSPS